MASFRHRSGGAGGLGKRLDSGFDGTSGGPIPLANLAADEQNVVFQALLDKFANLRSSLLGVCTISLNAGHEERFGQLLKAQPGFAYRLITGAAVDISGGSEDVSTRLMSMNKRNERNKSLRRGAEIIVSDDPEYVAKYYPIYESASAYWGIDPVPLAFLQDLLVSGAGQVFFVVVVAEEKVIGGHLNLHLGQRVIAWNGVTDPQYARTYHPATLCMWGDIVESCDRGAHWLDMGASGGVTSLEGFKKYFGAVIENRALYVNESFMFKAMREGRSIMQGFLKSVKSALVGGGEAQRWHDKVKPGSDKKSKEDS